MVFMHFTDPVVRIVLNRQVVRLEGEGDDAQITA
jgi:hypothetical protein